MKYKRTKENIKSFLRQTFKFLGMLTLGDILLIVTWLCGTLLLLSEDVPKVVCGVVLIGIGIAGMVFSRRG